ncbi:MAG: hypothetical protein WB507_12860 [Solirubrobacterales bacterium]
MTSARLPNCTADEGREWRCYVGPVFGRRCLSFMVAASAALCLPCTAQAGQRGAAQRLVDTYSPIMMLRTQEDPPCDTSEEQYQPTAVSTVLDNPAVELSEEVPGRGQVSVKRAPTAGDIAGLGERFYLNLPGDPLGDTCVYARDFAALKRQGRAPAVTYARIARQPGNPGLVVQYWFFWYFNQFNDVHEGDWEGMQIAFPEPNARAALAGGPSEMVLFQHGGGETAGWGDAKVEKQGTHPIVYPAAGSHATFYGSAIYVENGQNGSGLGCDNTTEPLRRLVPRPVLIPERPSAGGRFAWLTYSGHWGQKEKGFNNGPTGPQTKTQWREPFTWMEGQRSTSPRLPGASVLGPAVTGAFCGAVATASHIVNLEAKSRPAAIAVVLGIAALLLLFVGVTKWSPVDLQQLRGRRAFGQLIRAARQLYGRHWRVLVPIGLTAIPIVGAVEGLKALIVGGGEGRRVDGSAGLTGLHLAIGDLIDSFGKPVAGAIVAAVIIVFMRLLVAGASAGFLASYRGMLRCFWRVVGGQLLATLGVTLMALTIIGIPFAIWKYVDWQFVQQEILFEDRGLREAFRRSSRLVSGRWWHTVRVAGFLWALSVITGPVLGFALIFANLSLAWINVFGSVVFALLIPYVALGRTLLYFDLAARDAEEPVRPRRLRRLFRGLRGGGLGGPAGADA